MDDEFDSIDFFAIDKLVENHQAKLQVQLFSHRSLYRLPVSHKYPIEKELN